MAAKKTLVAGLCQQQRSRFCDARHQSRKRVLKNKLAFSFYPFSPE
jgi:hypothetical protein